MPKDLMTIEEAGERVGRKTNTIHSWISRGRIKTYGKNEKGLTLVSLAEVAAVSAVSRRYRTKEQIQAEIAEASERADRTVLEPETSIAEENPTLFATTPPKPSTPKERVAGKARILAQMLDSIGVSSITIHATGEIKVQIVATEQW